MEENTRPPLSDPPGYSATSQLRSWVSTGKHRAERTPRRLSDQGNVLQRAVQHAEPAIPLIMTEFGGDDWRCTLYHGSITAIKDWLAKKSSTKSDAVNHEISEDDQKLPLHVAALRGAEYVKVLLDAGADVNGTSSSNGTALQWAASTGDKDTVQLLLKHGANVNAKAGWRGTALIAAVRACKPLIVELLLKHRAHPDQLDLYKTSSALSVATDLQSVRSLLENGANIHKKTRDIHILAKAVSANDTAMVQLLLSHGADANMRLEEESLLDCAAELENTAVVESLLKHGATLSSNPPKNLLSLAAIDGHMSLAKLLLHRGADPNSPDVKYGSPLTAASSNGHIDMITLLLSAGADINRIHKHEVYRSPLHAAILNDRWDTVLFLMERGADVPNTDSWGNGNDVPRLRLCRNAVLKHTYSEFGDLARDFSDPNNSIRIADIMFAWEIPTVLALARSRQEDSVGPADLIEKSLENHIVLVRWSATGDNGGEVLRTKATTCSEYVERRWGSLGRHVLKNVAHVAHQDTNEVFRFTYEQDSERALFYTFSIDPDTHQLSVSIDYVNSSQAAPILDFVSAIDWIFRAVREPSSEDGAVSSSLCQISSISQTRQTGQSDRTPTSGFIFTIQLTFRLSKRPLVKTDNDCWWQLFKSFYVVEDDNPDRGLISFGKGLEMSFDLMVALAGATFPVAVGSGVVLVGYHTVLIPIKIEGNSAQFHLEVNNEGQINPYALRYGQRHRCLVYDDFKPLRCFVGWCERAHILLGTSALHAASVRYTDSQERRRTLQLMGLSAGFQAITSGPIQAGVTGQANFSFVTNRVSFSPSVVYSKMLRNTAKEVALVYDVAAKRSWLVSKLSLLLHMAHVWVKENMPQNQIYNPKSNDPIPFAEPHYDGFEVVEALENVGDTVLCGEGEDAFRLRTLLLGLNINLLQTMAATESSDSRTLYGYELMDVVTEPGKGSTMKKITVCADGRDSHWVKIANLVDSVIVCSDIGAAIVPAEISQRKSITCNFLPCGLDWLAAHITCVGHLTKRCGQQLAPFVQTSEIKLGQDKCWNLTGEPFKSCNHDNRSMETCWNRHNILQRVEKAGQTRSDSRSPTSTRICLTGAVVFGKCARR